MSDLVSGPLESTLSSFSEINLLPTQVLSNLHPTVTPGDEFRTHPIQSAGNTTTGEPVPVITHKAYYHGPPHHGSAPLGHQPDNGCHITWIRQEWRTLTNKQKHDYLNAVKCLQSKPANTSFAAVRTHFDDFQALHINLTKSIHLVGHFLPWHRRFVQVYETALREECGYQGSQPYWDWSLDADDIMASPVFSPDTGFGGNGVDGTYTDLYGTDSSPPTNHTSGWGGGCVLDGPFSSYRLALGPGQRINDHCIVRNINQTFSQFITYAQVANTTRQPTFELFRIELEGKGVTPTHKIHDGGHFAVGGEMGNLYSSPGDPLFFLHHGNLDRIWWEWQKADFSNRLYQISGRTSINPPFVNVTLDFPMKMLELAPDIPARDVMDIRSIPLCYNYK
ncbi:hypothetical protein BDQ12DRAFT_669943 [Crucibulum laeve]|uniref:Tyrosinase copper-binding domain-containing protein n=1 Tax=Crucibulum laeve TaxID=68775 RepID=A0A5C3LM98_9AGAR|nr:hypothetical protein BDQ12DRAFT_669943 [Crucibulum laeve]